MRALPQPRIRQFRVQDVEEVVGLWEACGLTRPWNDPRADIARKLTTQPDLFLRSLGYEENDVINLGKRLIADTH